MPDPPGDESSAHTRRRRYPGRHPRDFRDKYKELNPARYPEERLKIIASGKTPAGTHRPIMVAEVLECLDPQPGDIAVDCTLGGGGHAQAILDRITPGGRLIGIDADPFELPRTEARLRTAGYGPDRFVTCLANFAGLHKALVGVGIDRTNLLLADLGVSSMQYDNPARGFSYKVAGPLDMRMNQQKGEPAAELIERTTQTQLEHLLQDNADEPHACIIAELLKRQPLQTTHALERVLRTGLTLAVPQISKADVKLSTRRTFQALRIAVNDEFAALETLLRTVPHCLAPGGRVAVLTFHSGEDRRVKKALQAGFREGVYADIARTVIRSSKEETFSNRRASSAKLRWAIRA